MGKKLSYQEVYDYFESKGCKLLEKEYIRNDIPMKYICECGNESEICFASFKNGSRCKECGKKKSADATRLSYEYVYNYFESKGCKLLEDEYINNSTDMKYKCKCGNITYSRFDNFQHSDGCRICNNKPKLTYEYVYSFFEKEKYILLETDYKNDTIKMKYQCDKGHVDYMNFNNFRAGYRCPTCYLEYNRGPNHHNWNPNLTDEERKENESRQSDPKYKQWRNQIFKCNDYTCQICGQKHGDILVHHLDGWNWCPEKRYDINNGIVICKQHHDEFHNLYKYGNNTKEQFEEYQQKLQAIKLDLEKG